MTGWGRTGKWFAHEHFENVVPDIMTSAKGISGAFIPLSMVAMNAKIQEFC